MSKKPAAFVAQLSLLILLLLAISTPGVPQDPLRNQEPPPLPKQRPRKVFPNEQEPEDILRIDTDLVSVDVTAVDATGNPIKNLKQEDFKVYSDGVEQPISFFQIEKRQ